jgi:hypothetical protein
MTTKTKAKFVPLEIDACHWVATEGSILVPEVRAVVITVGLELKSQKHGISNNWRAEHGRRQQLRKRMCVRLGTIPFWGVEAHLDGKPTKIEFTRLAPRMLDSDNLASVFKPIRDQVCAWLVGKNDSSARADDGMRSGYTFSYHQQQQRAYGVRVELAP